MYSKIVAACAIATATVATETEQSFASAYASEPSQYGRADIGHREVGYGKRDEGYGRSPIRQSLRQAPVSRRARGDVLNRGLSRGLNRGYGDDRKQVHQVRNDYAAPQGYGNQRSNGFRWERASTFRPRDIKTYNAAPVDAYWQHAPKETETVRAACEFDFLGYSYSTGRFAITQKPGDLTEFIGEFEGLKPGLHSLKIHEFGDLEYGCESTGEIFNPFGAKQGHSHFDITERRVGDCENVQARFDTNAEYKNRDLLANLSGPNSIIGRSLVLYEREDDFDQTEHPETHDREGRFREGKGQRIACCVVGLAKGEVEKPKAVSKPLFKASKAPHRGFQGFSGLH